MYMRAKRYIISLVCVGSKKIADWNSCIDESQGNYPKFELIDLSFSIPSDLDDLSSAQLAVSFIPKFTSLRSY